MSKFIEPGIFDRLHPIRWVRARQLVVLRQTQSQESKNALIERKSSKDESIIIASKGDSVDFSGQCLEAIALARILGNRFWWLALMVKIIACIFGVIAAITSLYVWQVSFAFGIGAGILPVIDQAFGWNSMCEKYSALIVSFKRLRSATDSEKYGRFEELKLLLEASILESDFKE
jgi:hypothetical protein